MKWDKVSIKVGGSLKTRRWELCVCWPSQNSDTYRSQSYFQVAANLGDPDAQQSLAFCLTHGKGCKRDRKEAAKWYRAAVRSPPPPEDCPVRITKHFPGVPRRDQ